MDIDIRQKIKETGLQHELEEIGADIGYIIFKLAEYVFFPTDMVYPSDPKELKKIKNRNYKRMERRIKEHVTKDKWKEILKLLKDITTVPTLNQLSALTCR